MFYGGKSPFEDSTSTSLNSSELVLDVLPPYSPHNSPLKQRRLDNAHMNSLLVDRIQVGLVRSVCNVPYFRLIILGYLDFTTQYVSITSLIQVCQSKNKQASKIAV